MLAPRTFSFAGVAVALGLLCNGAGAMTILAVQRTSSVSSLALRSAEQRAAEEQEAEDTLFWASEWGALEAELLRLRAAAAANITTTSQAKAAATVVAPAPPKHHSKSPLAGLKLNLEPKTPADLAPALAMLKGLYEDGKDRISKLNLREKDSKRKFEEKQASHQKRLDEIDARFKNHTLSAEFRTNETRDEDRIWNYWERVRERQHKQFHTSLKIQHATLDKVKTMIDMYEKTMSGKADKNQVAKQLAKVGGGALPEVVLLQDARRAAAKFCDEALAEVRSQEAVLLQTGSQGRRSEV